MAKYKIISYDKLILQGMSVEQKIAQINETNDDTIIDEVPTMYNLGINDTLCFSSMRELVSYYMEQELYIPPISKLEFVGQMDYMKNVIKEETTDGIIRFYSYVDKHNYYVFSLNDALSSKIASWTHVNGNLTRIYEEMQKRGAMIDFSDNGLKLVNRMI